MDNKQLILFVLVVLFLSSCNSVEPRLGVKLTGEDLSLYIVTPDTELQVQLATRYAELIAAENALGFDPFASDADFAALLQAGGYESLDAAGCSDINPQLDII